MRGRAHLYERSHINTDEIIPARYLNVHDEVLLAEHAMEDIDPGFVGRVKWGDFIVAGEDFGCGSSREHAIWALRGAGLQAVLADSFARIFYRNAINNGFYPIEIKGISQQVKPKDELAIDITEGTVRNLTRKEAYDFPPFPTFVQVVIEAGGLLSYLQQQETGRSIT
ncbi:MAG: 3-isopropylmalate dehydratase [Fidelibacterota bacterium]|nr:MAG: 3-isopropylmalate dehydratase [Candidatus Neomarinimicrobiota bacterium]